MDSPEYFGIGTGLKHLLALVNELFCSAAVKVLKLLQLHRTHCG